MNIHPYPYFAWINGGIWNIEINSIDTNMEKVNVTTSEGCPFVIQSEQGFANDYSKTGNIPLKDVRIADKLRGYVIPLPLDLELIRQSIHAVEAQ